ncbi:MAG: hypothetical protein RR778_15820, partial [Glutamicibacter sp.]|uniref:hypothetical protein n=1 Tax=Glutamicibacter sp. TaxID=1931995 RepID=UPI002FCA6FB9
QIACCPELLGIAHGGPLRDGRLRPTEFFGLQDSIYFSAQFWRIVASPCVVQVLNFTNFVQ